MRVAFFETQSYDRAAFVAANTVQEHTLTFLEPRLTADTAYLAAGYPVVCSFVNDRVDGKAIAILQDGGTQMIALRSTGYNHVDLRAAAAAGIKVTRVPEYSPYAVAEHTVALILTLNRKTHQAFNRVRELNFSLDGLVGFDLHGKTVGILGTGRIGSAFARIMHGFGCRILAYDIAPKPSLIAELGVQYVDLEKLISASDIISLHLPLTPETKHVIDAAAFARMRPNVMLVNTSRGGLLDTMALIQALKRRQIATAALDVYEEEAGIFFQDLSETILQDDVLARLLTFPNVLITSHQAFLTKEALANIAIVTLQNITAFEQGATLANEVVMEESAKKFLR